MERSRPTQAFEKLPAPAVEPLHAELQAFLEAVRFRQEPRTNGAAGYAALELAGRVMTSIREHAQRVHIQDSRAASGDLPGFDVAGVHKFVEPQKTTK